MQQRLVALAAGEGFTASAYPSVAPLGAVFMAALGWAFIQWFYCNHSPDTGLKSHAKRCHYRCSSCCCYCVHIAPTGELETALALLGLFKAL